MQSGGPAAIRGFRLQVLITLLEALDNADWSTVSIEPEGLERVDVKWTRLDGSVRHVQVKSSCNPFTAAKVRTWARELAAARVGTALQELLLLGAGLDSTQLNEIALETAMEIRALGSAATWLYADAAAHRVDAFLGRAGSRPVPSTIRELLASSLAEHLMAGAESCRVWSREEFERQLVKYVSLAYPDAVVEEQLARCEVLWNVVMVVRPHDTRGYGVVIPVEVVNVGTAVAIVDWVALRLRATGKEWIYEARDVADEVDLVRSSMVRGPPARTKPFTAFAIRAGHSVPLALSFVWRDHLDSSLAEPPHVPTELTLYVKLRGASVATKSPTESLLLGKESTQILERRELVVIRRNQPDPE